MAWADCKVGIWKWLAQIILQVSWKVIFSNDGLCKQILAVFACMEAVALLNSPWQSFLQSLASFHSFSAVLTERESEQKPQGNVICSPESSAGALGLADAQLCPHKHLLLFISITLPGNVDLGLLSPCAFKEVLRSPQQEPGQETFLWRQLKDLLASSTSWMCTELWIPELTHPRPDGLTK